MVAVHDAVFALAEGPGTGGRLSLLGVRNGGRRYVVAFRRPSHAVRVATGYDPVRPPRLERRACTARLEVPVVPARTPTSTPLLLRSFPLEQFLVLPYDRMVGVVIVPLTSREDASPAGTLLGFEHAQVIEPWEAEGPAWTARCRALLTASWSAE